MVENNNLIIDITNFVTCSTILLFLVQTRYFTAFIEEHFLLNVWILSFSTDTLCKCFQLKLKLNLLLTLYME